MSGTRSRAQAAARSAPLTAAAVAQQSQYPAAARPSLCAADGVGRLNGEFVSFR